MIFKPLDQLGKTVLGKQIEIDVKLMCHRKQLVVGRLNQEGLGA
jgi:hypothetical protein